MRKLNVGLVGAGWMGKIHSYCYKAYRQFFGPEPLEPFLHTYVTFIYSISSNSASIISSNIK